jgi:hypothetical protein
MDTGKISLREREAVKATPGPRGAYGGGGKKRIKFSRVVVAKKSILKIRWHDDTESHSSVSFWGIKNRVEEFC